MLTAGRSTAGWRGPSQSRSLSGPQLGCRRRASPPGLADQRRHLVGDFVRTPVRRPAAISNEAFSLFHRCRLQPGHRSTSQSIPSVVGVTHVPGLFCYLCTRFVPADCLTTRCSRRAAWKDSVDSNWLWAPLAAERRALCGLIRHEAEDGTLTFEGAGPDGGPRKNETGTDSPAGSQARRNRSPGVRLDGAWGCRATE